jgi:hypothetical protein
MGNSHMLMQDKNNIQLADLILGWIDQHVEGKNRARKRAANSVANEQAGRLRSQFFGR